jgi:argininosuccinate lyase
MAGKTLWDKGKKLDKNIHKFTVGNDPVLDKNILEWDILASAAHAKMLEEQNLLKKEDLKSLLPALKEAYDKAKNNNFEIPWELEDCHTALEVFLTEKCGDSGKKIHLGRSRNDQVLVAMRLFLRNLVLENLKGLTKIAEIAHKKSKDSLKIQMPGHTHFQQAMPASVGMWFSAIRENCIELIEEGINLFNLLNKNPLGVGSGFGTPLNINREKTTSLLNFSKTQKNPINTQNSRGRYEIKVLRFLADISGMIEKFSFDLIIYSMQEIDFVKIPESFTTGSSIMPQKRNPDVLELLRASASKIRSKQYEAELLISKLPSHYHRDFQYTKEPVIESKFILETIVEIFSAVIETITFKTESLLKAKTPDLYSTYEAFRLVKSGLTFRDAYQETARKLANSEIKVEDLEKDFQFIVEGLLLEEAIAEETLANFSNLLDKISIELDQLPSKLL